jgi:hypothetical protein
MIPDIEVLIAKIGYALGKSLIIVLKKSFC